MIKRDNLKIKKRLNSKILFFISKSSSLSKPYIIFHYTCTIKEKVCIIFHLKHYKLMHLNKDTKVIVDKHSFFFIGHEYFDIVWCDVMHMVACHFFLERSWHFIQVWYMMVEKICTIVKCPTSKSIHENLSFHGLISFFRRFIQSLTSLIAPITRGVKKT